MISDRAGLSDGEPSPDGRWLSLEGRREGAPDVIEIRDLDKGFALHGELPEPKHAALRFSDHRAWNPDGSRLALAIDVMSPPEDRGGYVSRRVIRTYALIVVRDCSCYEELPTHLPGRSRPDGGTSHRCSGRSGESTATRRPEDAAWRSATPEAAAVAPSTTRDRSG